MYVGSVRALHSCVWGYFMGYSSQIKLLQGAEPGSQNHHMCRAVNPDSRDGNWHDPKTLVRQNGHKTPQPGSKVQATAILFHEKQTEPTNKRRESFIHQTRVSERKCQDILDHVPKDI
ncbi:hypothetical protein DPMN_092714 [Dreissena polymorpha]|uniref:Uncharacterized protein n=1 Tax=Dreissena polymorpha TaxID=45954 RepID=A0A9D4R1Z0_DREPO|nr:hypothetical protein DPMN_092714 [Dreissena polymorpha]